MQADWGIETYVDSLGRSPVADFIRELQSRERAHVLRTLDLLEEFGILLPFPHTAHIEGDLWELRAGAIRIFYFAHTGRRLILLHAYYKQSRKTPRPEIDMAQKRLADFRESERTK